MPFANREMLALTPFWVLCLAGLLGPWLPRRRWVWLALGSFACGYVGFLIHLESAVATTPHLGPGGRGLAVIATFLPLAVCTTSCVLRVAWWGVSRSILRRR